MASEIKPPPVRFWEDVKTNFREIESYLNAISRRFALKWTDFDFTGSSLSDILNRSHTLLSDKGTNTHAQIDTHIGSTSNPHSVTYTQAGAAPASKGVTNGDTHDHNGGDGGQINHTTLSSIGTNTHAQIDTHIGLEPIEAHGALAYGHMYLASPVTITVGASGTWYEVDTGATDFTGGEFNDVTFADHYLTVAKAGKYFISFDLALDSGTNDEVGGAIMVNGTVVSAGAHGHSTIVVTGRSVQCASTAILSLAANDQVSVAVQNHTAAANIIVEHASVSIVQVG